MENGSQRLKVLIVDDDERLQAVVREFLENYDYAVYSMGSGKGLMEELDRLRPDIVLLDVMLPGEDGFTLLRRLREVSRVPVIMLTARGEDIDRIIGLEIGADDYLPKPYNPRELLARIKAVLRRAPAPGQDAADPASGAGDSGPEAPVPGGMLRAGSFTLDTKRQRLGRDGRSTELSTTEYRIIFAFMKHAGEVLSRDRVLSLAFGDDHYVSDRNIDVYISRIRAILRRLGEGDTRIRTVWGSGYSWIKES